MKRFSEPFRKISLFVFLLNFTACSYESNEVKAHGNLTQVEYDKISDKTILTIAESRLVNRVELPHDRTSNLNEYLGKEIEVKYLKRTIGKSESISVEIKKLD